MGSSKSNERVSTTIGTIGLPRLAPSLLTLTGSCKIYYVFETERRPLHLVVYSLQVQFAKEKSLTITNIFKTSLQTCKSNEAPTPLLTIGEVENVQRQRIASFIWYVFQPTYAAFIEKPPHWRRTAESLSLLGNIFSSSLA